MGQSAWLKTSCHTLQGATSRVNGGGIGRSGKPLIASDLIIFDRTREGRQCVADREERIYALYDG